MSKVLELFGHTTKDDAHDWRAAVAARHCPFLDRVCVKTRKSAPEIALGTCVVKHGADPIVICPHRFLERRLIFTDAMLLVRHEAGNELHLVPEVSVPGGNVDYILVSARQRKARDFVGIEIQTLDTTGTVWPARQRFIASKGLKTEKMDRDSESSFGINWKMSAKTILMQLHHKVQTFETVKRHIVLAVQDKFMHYIRREFSTEHIVKARPADPLQIHVYSLDYRERPGLSMELVEQLGTDAKGVEKALGLQVEARVELETIFAALEEKMSDATLLRL